jgi:hypothetical protein
MARWHFSLSLQARNHVPATTFSPGGALPHLTDLDARGDRRGVDPHPA